MALKFPNETNERRFCWEQVLRTNRLFRISQVFAPPGRAGQLLPLYALFAAIEEACSKHSDEQVARHKLDWWRRELLQRGVQRSDHPILRELAQSGAYKALDPGSLGRLFDNAEARLDAASPAELEDLHEHCRQLGEPRVELELSVCGCSLPIAQPVEAIAVTIGLAQLLRETEWRTARNNYWWVPLSLLARHGVSRVDITQGTKTEGVQALFAQLIGASHDWLQTADCQEQSPKRAPEAARHLFVMNHLQAHALLRLRSDRYGQFATELNHVGVGQLYQAWKAARLATRP